MATMNLTKAAVLEGIQTHIRSGALVQADYLDNGDLAYIMVPCCIAGNKLYVKVKFSGQGDAERMTIISAHEPRIW